MKFGLIVLIVLGASTIASAADLICNPSQYVVRGHGRREYTRSDGTFVRATTVTTYCKERTPGFNFAENRIKNGLPKGWPNKTELPADWTVDERERLIEALDELPNGLLSNKMWEFTALKNPKTFLILRAT